jgi:DNA (cytosine-5)-methyltransferase 1
MRFVDLFAGAGGLARGLLDAGFDHVVGVEGCSPDAEPEDVRQSADARATYAANIGPVLALDLSNPIAAAKVLRPYLCDVIVAGPPCTEFSEAGKRDETGGLADLTMTFAVVCATLQPRAIMWENVVPSRESFRYKAAVAILREAGYAVEAIVLNGPYVGVPQKRKRLITFAVRGMESIAVIHRLHLDALSGEYLTLRKYCAAIGYQFPEYYYYPSRMSELRRAVYSLDEAAPTTRGQIRGLPPTRKPHPRDAVSDWSRVSSLDIADLAVIQTFSPDFKFAGTSLGSKAKQIGNAVPPAMGRVAGSLLRQLLDLPPTVDQMSLALFDSNGTVLREC